MEEGRQNHWPVEPIAEETDWPRWKKWVVFLLISAAMVAIFNLALYKLARANELSPHGIVAADHPELFGYRPVKVMLTEDGDLLINYIGKEKSDRIPGEDFVRSEARKKKHTLATSQLYVKKKKGRCTTYHFLTRENVQFAIMTCAKKY